MQRFVPPLYLPMRFLAVVIPNQPRHLWICQAKRLLVLDFVVSIPPDDSSRISPDANEQALALRYCRGQAAEGADANDLERTESASVDAAFKLRSWWPRLT